VRKLALFAGLLAPITLTAPTASAAEAPACSTPCITEYAAPVPVVYSGPFGIAKGLGDDMRFGDQNTIDRIGRYGNFTGYTIPTPSNVPPAVQEDPDGIVWFTESFFSPDRNKIGRLHPYASDQS
jgi:streptogramin lyase